jgi:DNA-binding transcriptional LysR family regulator
MDLSSVQPSALQTFAAVVRSGSFTDAARELGLSQSGVSQTVDRLERQLGLTLFDRSVRPLRVTAAGEEVFALAERLVGESRFFADSVERIREGEVLSLRMGISEVAGSYAGPAIEAALIPALKAFEGRTGLIPKMIDDFVAHRVDLVIAPDVPPEHRIAAHPLLRERYLIVAPKIPGVERDGLPLEALKPLRRLPFVSYVQQSLDWRKSLAMLRMLGLPSVSSIALENTAALANAVVGGLGWTILPPMSLWCVRDRLGAVTLHGLDGLPAEKTLWAAVHSARCRHLCDKAAEVFRREFRRSWLPQMKAAKPGIERYMKLLSDEDAATAA